MSFMEAISSGFGKYAAFAGRASRSEYWFWILFFVIVVMIASALDIMLLSDMDFRPLAGIACLGLFLPTLAMAIRRLHDLDRSGWWYLISLTGIGGIVLFVWYCMKGTTGPNQYGPDPVP